jgi:hypothetical protein
MKDFLFMPCHRFVRLTARFYLSVRKEIADMSLVEGVVDGLQMDFNVNVPYLHQRAREVSGDVTDFAKDWQETPVFFIQFLSIGIGNHFRRFQTTSRRRYFRRNMRTSCYQILWCASNSST